MPTTIDRPGRPGRPPLPMAVWLFAWVSLLNEVSAQMVAPLIPLLLASVLAAGPVAIGLVDGLADAVAALVKLGSGRLADARPGQRKRLVMLGYGLALASRPLIGQVLHWPIVALLRATDRLGKGLRGAPRDAMLAEATPTEVRGQAYGLNRGMDYVGAVVGTLIAAGVLAWSGLEIRQVIGWSVMPGLAVLGLLWALPSPASSPAGTPGAEPARADKASAPSASPWLSAWATLPSELRRLLALLAAAALARAPEAFIVLRGHELGWSPVPLLLLWAWLAAVQSAIALWAAPWTDRLAKRRLLAWQWAGLAVGYGALALAFDGIGLCLAVTLYGLVSGIGEGLERALVSQTCDASHKGTAFGWYHLLTGLAALAGGLLVGGLWHIGGAALAFGAAAAGCLACSGRLADARLRHG